MRSMIIRWHMHAANKKRLLLTLADLHVAPHVAAIGRAGGDVLGVQETAELQDAEKELGREQCIVYVVHAGKVPGGTGSERR